MGTLGLNQSSAVTHACVLGVSHVLCQHSASPGCVSPATQGERIVAPAPRLHLEHNSTHEC